MLWRHTSHRFVFVAASLVIGVTATSDAQATAESRGVNVGTRVRVFAPDLRLDRYVGRVEAMDTQAMVLDTAGARIRLGIDLGPVLVDEYRRVTIRIASIREIEVSAGRTARGATMKGVIVGALAGGLLWGLGNLPEVNPSAGDFAKGFPAGAVIGGVLGGAIGFALGGERWMPAVIPR